MTLAPDSGQKSLPWRLALGLAAAACLAQTGCARLYPFRKSGDVPPAFGTEMTSSEASRKSPRAGDLYAERVSRTKPGVELATAEEQPRGGPAAGGEALADEAVPIKRAGRAGRPVGESLADIALQKPEKLPSFTDPSADLTAVADRSRRSGWQPEGKAAAAAEPVAHEASPPPAQAAPSSPAPAGPTLDSLIAGSESALDALTSYQVRMSGQERVGNNLNPVEEVVLSVRSKPKAVRIEWREGSHKGREVLYASDANNGQMHIRMGESVLALGRLSMSPESPLARKNGRHPINEAGFDTIVHNMADGLRKQKAGDPSGGKLNYAGLETPEGLTSSAHKITRVLPGGETWVVYLDPKSMLPTFVQETSPTGELLERYVFRDLTPNVPELAKADAYDPDARWGPPKGLFQRLARTPGADDATRTR